MAVKMVLIDDVDGTEGAETINFGLDGKEYQIDLVDRNAAKMRKALEPFIKVARSKGSAHSTNGNQPKTKKPARSRAPRLSGQTEQKQAMREWGRKRGMKVSDRGRVPKDVVDQFNKEHPLEPAFSG